MLVPMIATSVPGRVTVAAGTETCASTLATATASRAAARSSAAARSLRPPADSPIGTIVRDILSSTTVPKPGSSASKNAASGNPSVGRPERLVAGRAVVPRLDAGQLPDDPVGRLDQAVGRRVDLGCLAQDLERLREEPLGRDLAAVALEPRLAELARRRG